ncbi:MAG: KdsC family phosphatase [Planctomycetota bacterium]|jgi:3-deoxy-D-manno-octulosonate 8-phosphate phosphatase (KDO 8-P phosphatase)
MAGKQKSELAAIEMLVMDVDGVFTDGTIIIGDDGTESKRFNYLDGHGIKLWHRAGMKSAIISGKDSTATKIRAEQLGIEHVMLGHIRKLPAFESLLADTGLVAGQIAYVGDDLLDLPLVRRAGFSVAVPNAIDELKEAADYVTNRQGGAGAVREVVEHILKATGRWDKLMERYLV